MKTINMLKIINMYLELFKNKCYGINLKEQLLVYRVLNSNISHTNSDKQEDLACRAINNALQDCYGINVNTQLIKKIRSAIIYRERLGANKYRRGHNLFKKFI